MSFPYQPPAAQFDAALGDNATGHYLPARAEVAGGFVSLWVASPSGWRQLFSVPAHEVTVKSAAQRITLVVRGQSYPLLANPRTVRRSIQYGIAGGMADILDKPRFEMGVDLARGVNVAGSAYAFQQRGGPAFLAAAKQSGAQTSRLGYGPILAIGCAAGLAVVVIVTLITVVAINL
ncbi:hypothetical protein [Microbacterium gorillae]|uniref:hypothetical protein n=1 Tax=Microbacterium gorillae TaxID=1231063 RepID=UPI003D95C7DE